MKEIDVALVRAAVSGDISKVREFLDKGADVNAKIDNDWASLIIASGKGYTEIVKLLLSKGADVNVRNQAGSTALINSAAAGHTEVVSFLLANGADINLKIIGTGATALQLASKAGHAAIVKLLTDAVPLENKAAPAKSVLHSANCPECNRALNLALAPIGSNDKAENEKNITCRGCGENISIKIPAGHVVKDILWPLSYL